MPTEQEVKDAYKHLDDFRPRAMALDDGSLTPTRVSRERFLELMRGLSDRIEPVLTKVKPKLSPEYFAELSGLVPQLVPLGLAFFAADLETETAISDVEKARRAVLVPLVRDHDRQLFPVVELLWGDDPVHGATVAAIRSGTGIRDDAADVLAGARLAEADPGRFERQQLVSRDDLNLWKRNATELLSIVDKGDLTHPARKLQQRVFNLGVATFDELNWVARFATRDIDSWPAVSSRAARTPDKKPTAGGDPGAEPVVPT